MLFFLCWGQVLLQQVHIVSVSPEHTLVVHNVEGLAVILLIIVVGVCVIAGVALLEFVLLADDLGLGTLKRLGHIFKFIN